MLDQIIPTYNYNNHLLAGGEDGAVDPRPKLDLLQPQARAKRRRAAADPGAPAAAAVAAPVPASDVQARDGMHRQDASNKPQWLVVL